MYIIVPQKSKASRRNKERACCKSGRAGVAASAPGSYSNISTLTAQNNTARHRRGEEIHCFALAGATAQRHAVGALPFARWKHSNIFIRKPHTAKTSNITFARWTHRTLQRQRCGVCGEILMSSTVQCVIQAAKSDRRPTHKSNRDGKS